MAGSKAIFKYPIYGPHAAMPAKAVIKHVDFQNGVPTVWAEVELPITDEENENQRRFDIYPTGAIVPSEYIHLHTWGEQDMSLVFHLYEIPRPD